MKKYYYTIGEVSNLLNLKPHVIRYWESEFSVLRPKKSGSRIRRYNEDHILLLKKIKDMLYNQRYTIDGARQKLKNEREAIKSIALDALPVTKPSSSLSNPELFNLLTDLRAKLQSLVTLCANHSKEHK